MLPIIQSVALEKEPLELVGCHSDGMGWLPITFNAVHLCLNQASIHVVERSFKLLLGMFAVEKERKLF